MQRIRYAGCRYRALERIRYYTILLSQTPGFSSRFSVETVVQRNLSHSSAQAPIICRGTCYPSGGRRVLLVEQAEVALAQMNWCLSSGVEGREIYICWNEVRSQV